MADSKFIGVAISFLLTGLFFVMFITWAGGTAEYYGYDSSLITDERLNSSGLEDTLDAIGEQSESWEEKFKESEGVFESGVVFLTGIGGILIGIFDALMSLWDYFTVIIYEVIGIPPIATSILTVVLIIALVYWGYKALKAND